MLLTVARKDLRDQQTKTDVERAFRSFLVLPGQPGNIVSFICIDKRIWGTSGHRSIAYYQEALGL